MNLSNPKYYDSAVIGAGGSLSGRRKKAASATNTPVPAKPARVPHRYRPFIPSQLRAWSTRAYLSIFSSLSGIFNSARTFPAVIFTFYLGSDWNKLFTRTFPSFRGIFLFKPFVNAWPARLGGGLPHGFIIFLNWDFSFSFTRVGFRPNP